MRLPIFYYGDLILRKKAEPVAKITDEIKQLAADMIETMDVSNGIGLAAPQVGKSIRLFVLRNYVDQEDGTLGFSDPIVYINPKIISYSEEKVVDVEACISLPGLRGDVERPFKIVIEAMDLNGHLFTEEVEGYNARVRMHENDHLNGVLFIDRMALPDRKKLEPQLFKLKKSKKP